MTEIRNCGNCGNADEGVCWYAGEVGSAMEACDKWESREIEQTTDDVWLDRNPFSGGF